MATINVSICNWVVLQRVNYINELHFEYLEVIRLHRISAFQKDKVVMKESDVLDLL